MEPPSERVSITLWRQHSPNRFADSRKTIRQGNGVGRTYPPTLKAVRLREKPKLSLGPSPSESEHQKAISYQPSGVIRRLRICAIEQTGNFILVSWNRRPQHNSKV